MGEVVAFVAAPPTVSVRIGYAVWGELTCINPDPDAADFRVQCPNGAEAAYAVKIWRREGATAELTRAELVMLESDLDVLSRRTACAALRDRVRHYLRHGEWPTPTPRPKSKPRPAIPEAVKSEAEALIKATVAECLAALRATACYVLPSGWSPNVKIAWGAYKRGGHGGQSGIWLAPTRWLDTAGGPKHCDEYADIAADPVIGDAWFADWRGVLKCVTAHETAHAVQLGILNGTAIGGDYGDCNAPFEGPLKRTDCAKPHGKGWREIYRTLRLAVVNPHRTTPQS